MSEQRSAPRVGISTRATVSEGRRSAAFTIDSLSISGARLVGPLVLKLGQRIEIVLQLDTGPIQVDAEVVRVDTPDLMTDQIAVRFVDPSPETRASIREVVRQRLEQVSGNTDDEAE
jgi:hypothetical protein